MGRRSARPRFRLARHLDRDGGRRHHSGWALRLHADRRRAASLRRITAAVVAFLTAWSLLAVHRLVAWEVPILGARFAIVRYGVSLALPVLAGLITRLLARGG
ncbi:MAG: hypothetical protein JRG95_03295 [Deltaproteobacteria bacterium]|nr:hypothetical protein [Deltaproteobacteria bacterium]